MCSAPILPHPLPPQTQCGRPPQKQTSPNSPVGLRTISSTPGVDRAPTQPVYDEGCLLGNPRSPYSRMKIQFSELSQVSFFLFYCFPVNSLALNIRTKFMSVSCEILLSWTPQNITNGKSTLVQLIAWCCQATSRYLNHWCSSRSMSPYGITSTQWLNNIKLTNVSLVTVTWLSDRVPLWYSIQWASGGMLHFGHKPTSWKK